MTVRWTVRADPGLSRSEGESAIMYKKIKFRTALGLSRSEGESAIFYVRSLYENKISPLHISCKRCKI